MCGERFVGSAIAGYHRWYSGSVRKGFKQKLCAKCAKLHYAGVMEWAINEEAEDPQWPDTCPTCNGSLEVDPQQTWTVWYRGKNKQSVTYIQCVHCAGGLRTLMMHGSLTLEDREPAGVREGGAPLPNPQGSAGERDLPW